MRRSEAFRQGDVLLLRIAELPAPTRELARRDGRVVLAEGETTGYAHAIEALGARLLERRSKHPIEARLAAEGRIPGRFLVVEDGAAQLVHEEHDPITIPPGIYEVRRQREYDPLVRLRGRRVSD